MRTGGSKSRGLLGAAAPVRAHEWESPGEGEPHRGLSGPAGRAHRDIWTHSGQSSPKWTGLIKQGSLQFFFLKLHSFNTEELY